MTHLGYAAGVPHLPDLEAWAIFACVAEHGSFSAAATATALSKPTISKAIARLEARLGITLFHRTSRRVTLTEAGRALADHARRLLADARLAEEAALEGAAALAGPIRVSAPMSFGIAHVAPVIAQFLAAHDRIEIELSLSDATTDIVAEGFDIALRIGALPDSSLRARRLRTIATHIIAAPAYLDRYGRPQHAAQLSEHRLLGYANVGGALHLRGPDGAEVTVRTAGPLRANSGEAMLPALRAGLGVALLPDFLIDDDLAAGHVEPILTDWQSPAIALHLLTPPGTRRPARVDALISFLTTNLRDAPSPMSA
ncbi:MAG: LysR family transcriptional regulator [Sphingomonas sp.]|uniref:LysR family transcriptional regulator n=1 Tax=Sphingomonas sp. TaxID=28214 RepID=UPI000DB2EC80|nr:LysR family transcriptional regulator [Zymomonas sp.]MBA4771681.1 LysR family transcriptional regulator [Sphingomonas sp.]PZP13076.1 MAG: LysR family transcriptional regulator [Sphingomonas hengshuiensis]